MSVNKIFFASDFHFGVPDHRTSREREDRVVRWLEQIRHEASEIYLIGDIFDFWFEYGAVIPKGFIRFQGKIAELVDSGIKIFFFKGNHDMWMFDYLPKEIGIQLYREPIVREYNSKKFFIGHGDGLGPGDKGYKFLKKVFANKFCQWCFARLHPNFSFWLANTSSKKSRLHTSVDDEKYLGDDKEWLAIFCRETLEKEHFDYFVFGHRHYPIDIIVGENSKYINLGEWMNYHTYAEFDGEKLELKKFESL